VLDFVLVSGPSSRNPSPIIRFGAFEVSLDSGELRLQGKRVKLQEQPFQVLVALLERPGELVSREELRTKLWPADTFVDFDHSLNAAVKRLRDALGDSADAPLFVETLARRGYRFIGSIDGPDVPGETALVVAPERSHALSSRFWIAAAFVSFIVVGVLVLLVRRLPSRPTQIVERKLTANSSENKIHSAAVSPDGKYLAYTDDTSTYLKLISTGETHTVPLPPDFSPRIHIDAWFPDGSHLLVSHQEQLAKQGNGLPGIGHSLWSISVFGGSPRHLADDGAGGSISPDGSHIAFQRSDFGREEWVMRSDGTEQVKVAADKSSWVGSPKWSPDGNRIAYIRMAQTYTTRESSLEVSEWRKHNAQTILSENNLGPSLYWLPNGFIVYTVGDTENQQGASLWMALPPASGNTLASPKRLTRGIGWINQVTGSADGKILAFLRENTVSSVYVGTLAPDGTHLLAHSKLTLDENQNLPFAWTPDSKAVFFSSNRNGSSEIFKQTTDQSLAENVVTSSEVLLQPRVTPDRSELLYISTPKSSDQKTPSSIFAVPITGGPARLLLRDVGIWNVECSPLPSAICLYSTMTGNTSQTFRFDVQTGKHSGPPQIDPSCNWSLSPDGLKRALVCDGEKGTIRLRSTLTGETRKLTIKGWDELGSVVWSADGRLLFAVWQHESDTALLRITLNGKISPLLRSMDPQILAAIPSPDGRSLAIAGASTTRNVWQIEDFR
jgi:DNA-binding winged helix-turn-helix (wHTH) protein/Tol biopolymer transport system component